MTRLTELANELMCDKGTQHFEAHGYTEFYAHLVPEHGAFDLLEIGVKYGSSLWMWNHWNKEMKVYGIDIEPLCCPLHPNVSVSVGSQSDYAFLKSTADQAKAFDVIIDDGSHRYSDIMTSFITLWPYVRYGGYYIIEDLHAPHARAKHVTQDVHNRISHNDHWASRTLFKGKMLVVRKTRLAHWPLYVKSFF